MIAWFCRLADVARHRGRLRSESPEQAAGRRGEDLAHRYLEGKGYVIVARNYVPPLGGGEIDLVAWQGEKLVFVEVKSRQSTAFGAPERNVDAEKRDNLIRAAADYARRAGVPEDRIRFDVVSVVLGQPPSISHLQGAFTAMRTL